MYSKFLTWEADLTNANKEVLRIIRCGNDSFSYFQFSHMTVEKRTSSFFEFDSLAFSSDSDRGRVWNNIPRPNKSYLLLFGLAISFDQFVAVLFDFGWRLTRFSLFGEDKQVLSWCHQMATGRQLAQQMMTSWLVIAQPFALYDHHFGACRKWHRRLSKSVLGQFMAELTWKWR